MTKVKTSAIDPDDPLLPKENSAIDVDLDVQEFDGDINDIECREYADNKVISYMEKEIRNSYEYKQYINYLKTELDITKCALIKNIDIKNMKVSLEFHHHPITLYDIVDIIISYKLAHMPNNETKVSMFDVMELVMKEHYAGNVGLVPLTKTVHEMYHNNAVKIPIDLVYGNYQEFIAKYKDYISPELMDKITSAESITSDNIDNYNSDKINKTVIHYNTTYNKKKDDED